MRIGMSILAVGLGAVVCLAQGDGTAPFDATEGPAKIAMRMFDPAAEVGSPVMREEALGALNAHYVSVKDETLKCIRRSVATGSGIAFGSPLHCAVQTVRTWRIAEAEGDLLERCAWTLDSSTVPAGRKMGIREFYPVADAMCSLPVRTKALVSKMTAGNFRVLTWVLVKSRGRDEAVLLLKHHADSGRFDAEVLKESMALLQRVQHEDELLPIPWKSDGK